jgi:hypothetical protein
MAGDQEELILTGLQQWSVKRQRIVFMRRLLFQTFVEGCHPHLAGFQLLKDIAQTYPFV